MDKDRYTVEKRVKIRKQIKASMKIFLKAKLTTTKNKSMIFLKTIGRFDLLDCKLNKKFKDMFSQLLA